MINGREALAGFDNSHHGFRVHSSSSCFKAMGLGKELELESLVYYYRLAVARSCLPSRRARAQAIARARRTTTSKPAKASGPPAENHCPAAA